MAIVNQAFARKFNLGDNPVGKRFSTDSGQNAKLDIEIVGVAQDAKYSDVKRVVPPQDHLPYRQDERLGSGYFYVRTALPPEQLLTSIPVLMKKLDPNLPVEDLKTMDMQIRENVFLDRLISTLSTGLRAAGDAAGGDWPLRRAGLHSGAADAGVRPAHGAGRRRRSRSRHGDGPGGQDGGGRRSDRPGGGRGGRAGSPSRCSSRWKGTIRWCSSPPPWRSASWRSARVLFLRSARLASIR